MGMLSAGWSVVGIDRDARMLKGYPGLALCADVFALRAAPVGFDLIWASPACQGYSAATPVAARGRHARDIPRLRRLLVGWGIPFIIENVPSAPLRRDLVLCGAMFGLPVVRHRVFELHGVRVRQPRHRLHPAHPVQLTGGGACHTPRRPGIGGERRKVAVAEARRIMGMPWATKRQVNEALPPEYSAYIFRHLEFLPT